MEPVTNPITSYQYFISSPYFAGFKNSDTPESKAFFEIYGRLPESVKNFISSEDTATAITLAGLKYELQEPQISKAAQLVRDVVLGNIFIKDFPSTLASQSNIDENKAAEVVNYIVSQSFTPIIEELKRIQRNKFPEKIAQIQKESSTVQKPDIPKPLTVPSPLPPVGMAPTVSQPSPALRPPAPPVSPSPALRPSTLPPSPPVQAQQTIPKSAPQSSPNISPAKPVLPQTPSGQSATVPQAKVSVPAPSFTPKPPQSSPLPPRQNAPNPVPATTPPVASPPKPSIPPPQFQKPATAPAAPMVPVAQAPKPEIKPAPVPTMEEIRAPKPTASPPVTQAPPIPPKLPPKPEFKIPDLGPFEAGSSTKTFGAAPIKPNPLPIQPTQPGAKEQLPSEAQKSLENELQKVASIIDLRNKPDA